MKSAFSAVAVAAMSLGGGAFAASPEELDRLRDAMALDQLISIVADEGIGQAGELQEEMLAGRGGRNWDLLVRNVYDPEELGATFTAAFDVALAEAEVAPLIGFYDSDLGERVRDLEIESRRAIISEEVEQAARERFSVLTEMDRPRVDLLEAFVEAGDLVERNVEGALNSNLAFYNGLLDGGAFEMTEAEVLSAVWSQEGEIREDTTGWIYAYLALAYDPLEDGELGEYVSLTESDAGQDLNRALFAGFDAVFLSVSYNLGKAVSLIMIGEDT